MKILLIVLLCSSVSVFAQTPPLRVDNLQVTGAPVQGTPASISRLLSLTVGGVGETVTPIKLWQSIVLTGDVDAVDITGISSFARTYLDDTTAGATLSTLGGTTIGQSIFSLVNPSAITFLRVNADNTVTSRTAGDLKTDLSLNNVDNTTDAGKPVSTSQQTALDLKANLTGAAFTGSISTTGDLVANTAGKGLQVKSGVNCRAGSVSLSGGTITVANTSVTANTVVFTSVGTATNPGFLSFTINPSTSFTITSSNGADASLVYWFLVEFIP